MRERGTGFAGGWEIVLAEYVGCADRKQSGDLT
jgi:hypothetical protein